MLNALFLIGFVVVVAALVCLPFALFGCKCGRRIEDGPCAECKRGPFGCNGD